MKKEEPKQETLEELAENYINKQLFDFGDLTHVAEHQAKQAFKNGYRLAQQNNNLYSEDEVLKLLHNYRNNFELYRNIQVLPNDFFEWFNQNKKK